MPRRLFLLLALLAGAPALAQVPDGDLRGGDLGAFRDTLDLRQPLALRPFVLPGSLTLRLDGIALDTTQYALDTRTGRLLLRLDPRPKVSSTLVAVYRTLPLAAFDGPIARRRIGETDTLGRRRVVEAERAEADEPLFGAPPRLRRRGSISRGIVAGNRRDVSIESGLRMELSGEVADGVEVQAVLTDENTPIQPEGTTQRLSDFDRVYVQLDTRRGQARLGDIDLAFTGTEFAPYVRKLQGAAVTANAPALFSGTLAGATATVAGATARGLFQSQDILALEGVQGPYRLVGREGEQFIIVIAGSERVYLDGQLLTRGEASDYVIDYATGEVTFTPRRLVTAERRITVDFEYTTSEFTRTVVGTEAEARLWARADGTERLRIRGTLLRESDGAAFADELGLTEADLDLIGASGLGPAVRSGAEPVPFDPESPFVLYARQDTVFAGQTVSIFVPATAEADSVFRVRFSRVEVGAGDYRRAGRAVNGILYEWVGPGAGDYVPLRLLPKPTLQQVLDLQVSAEPVAGLELFGEIARSTNDANRLDVAGGAGGSAGYGGLRLRPTPLRFGSLDAGTLSAEVVGRLRGETFQPLSRIRPVEFNRTWNVAQAGAGFTGIDTLAESTAEGVVRWASGEATHLQVEAGQIEIGDLFDGQRGGLDAAFRRERWPGLSYRLDVVDSENGFAGEEGRWLRQLGRLDYRLLGDRLVPFVEVEQERRDQRALGTDSLVVEALAFAEVRPGLGWTSSTLTAAASVEWRDEEQPLAGAFADAATVTTVQTDLRYRPSATYTTEAQVAYRLRNATEAFEETGFGDNESLVLRWTNRWTPLARAVELNTVYEAQTERSPVLQEIYLLVGPELGEFVWEDANGDGVQQLDEFREEITPLEGQYARTFVPGDDLIPTIGVQGRLRLRLDPARLFGDDASGWQRALARVSSLTTLDVQEKSEEPDLARVYLLNPGVLQDEATTLGGRFRIGQEFAFFRGDPRWSGRLFGQHLRSTNRLATGLERRRIQLVEAEARAVLFGPLSGELRGAAERNASGSPFASRRFDIRGVEVEPEATWRFGQAVSLSAGVRYARNRDAEASASGDDLTARILVLPLRARFAVAGRLQLLLQGERADVRLDGDATAGQAAFELTERRGDGTSYLWSASGQYTLNRFLRAGLNYEGRAPSEAPVVHNVRVQLSAVF
ncbi:MAG: hypothetical protein AAGI91_02785 [Bacteroidota bacterium]